MSGGANIPGCGMPPGMGMDGGGAAPNCMGKAGGWGGGVNAPGCGMAPKPCIAGGAGAAGMG